MIAGASGRPASAFALLEAHASSRSGRVAFLLTIAWACLAILTRRMMVPGGSGAGLIDTLVNMIVVVRPGLLLVAACGIVWLSLPTRSRGNASALDDLLPVAEWRATTSQLASVLVIASLWSAAWLPTPTILDFASSDAEMHGFAFPFDERSLVLGTFAVVAWGGAVSIAIARAFGRHPAVALAATTVVAVMGVTLVTTVQRYAIPIAAFASVLLLHASLLAGVALASGRLPPTRPARRAALGATLVLVATVAALAVAPVALTHWTHSMARHGGTYVANILPVRSGHGRAARVLIGCRVEHWHDILVGLGDSRSSRASEIAGTSSGVEASLRTTLPVGAMMAGPAALRQDDRWVSRPDVTSGVLSLLAQSRPWVRWSHHDELHAAAVDGDLVAAARRLERIELGEGVPQQAAWLEDGSLVYLSCRPIELGMIDSCDVAVRSPGGNLRIALSAPSAWAASWDYLIVGEADRILALPDTARRHDARPAGIDMALLEPPDHAPRPVRLGGRLVAVAPDLSRALVMRSRTDGERLRRSLWEVALARIDAEGRAVTERLVASEDVLPVGFAGLNPSMESEDWPRRPRVTPTGGLVFTEPGDRGAGELAPIASDDLSRVAWVKASVNGDRIEQAIVVLDVPTGHHHVVVGRDHLPRPAAFQSSAAGRHGAGVTLKGFTPDGSTLIYRTFEAIFTVDVTESAGGGSGEPVALFRWPREGSSASALSPTGQHVAHRHRPDPELMSASGDRLTLHGPATEAILLDLPARGEESIHWIHSIRWLDERRLGVILRSPRVDRVLVFDATDPAAAPTEVFRHER